MTLEEQVKARSSIKFKRRSELQMLIELLQSLKESPKTQYRLMCNLYTNHKGMVRYIEMLKKHKLIFHDTTYYHINNRGLEFLRLLDSDIN